MRYEKRKWVGEKKRSAVFALARSCVLTSSFWTSLEDNQLIFTSRPSLRGSIFVIVSYLLSFSFFFYVCLFLSFFFFLRFFLFICILLFSWSLVHYHSLSPLIILFIIGFLRLLLSLSDLDIFLQSTGLSCFLSFCLSISGINLLNSQLFLT